MKYFVHPQGICESSNVGEDTRIWAFAHVLPQAKIGKNCNICDQTFIENDVKIGDNVTVKCGVQIWDGVEIGDDVFIGPNATFTNDKFPRSKQYPDKFLKTTIEKGASLGANCTILPGITVGQNAMVGAGSVVTHSVPANAIVVGNPATIIGYVGSKNEVSSTGSTLEPENLLDGAKIIKISSHKDMRGSLIVSEFKKELPFMPKRFFMVYDVPNKKVRGEHAHKTCEQFLICVKGRVTALVDNGKERRQVELDSPEKGLYLPPLIWGTQYNYSSDAIMICFASKPYDSNDYIRDYSEYLRLVQDKK